jgi:hypothetical protein
MISTKTSACTCHTSVLSIRAAFLLAFLVGCFIYLSTLGAEFLGVMLWGPDIVTKSNQVLIASSLAWNFVTTVVAIVLLKSARQVVKAVFCAAVRTTKRSSDNAEEILSELLSYMESRFAMGALGGICLAWNVANMVMGMKAQIIQSCVILLVACMWCRVTLILLGAPGNFFIYSDDEEHTSTNTNNRSNDEEGATAPLLVA